MRALHATHHYDNTKSESAGKLIIESSMSTEEGVAVSDVTEDGTENSHEVGGGLHAEVSWEVGIPKIGNAGSKISPEVAYKYTHTKIDKTVKSTEDRDAWSVSCNYQPGARTLKADTRNSNHRLQQTCRHHDAEF